VVEAALTAARPAAARWKTSLAVAVLMVLLLALAFSGRWPELRSKLSSSPKGLIAIAPSEVERVDIRSGTESIALRRQIEGWRIDGVDGAAPAELVSHIDTALKFLRVSEPSREIPAGELAAESFAAFGLDPPSEVAVLEIHSAVAATVNFGTTNPAGTSHYVRVGGAPTVYLMPRHVTEEWRLLFDMARRLRGKASSAVASRGADLLLPVSMAQVWAIEIVAGGQLTRFERDAAGSWFKHVGQHSHAAGGLVHVADPAQARIIDAAFGGFDAAVAEARVAPGDAAHLVQYGLALPPLIVLFYPRDSSTPLARLEFGAAADKLDRYARLAPDGAVVTVAEFEPRRLTELLRVVGAGS
jgi:acylphosphatase